MDTKLINLFLIGCICAIPVTFSNCAGQNNSNSLDQKIKKEDFVKAYKVSFICGCINAGTKENLNKFVKDNNDLGLFTEVEMISHSVVMEADSVGREYAKKTTPLDYGDAKGRSPYISDCLWFSLSKEVDRIAEKRYKFYQRSK